MFIGHFGVGFASKKIENKISLGTLFLAAQLIDLLWPVFILIGLEKVKIEPGISQVTPLNFVSYPYTHSLFGVVIWGILFTGIYFLIKKNLKASLLLAGLVLSHWILDFLTHIPDLQIFPWGETRVGLGLWNSMPLTILIEGLIFCVGIYFYFKNTSASNKKGNYTFIGLIIFLSIIYVMNIFGSAPPSETAIGYAGLLQWLIVAWGYWIDRNRMSNIKPT